MLGTTGNLYEGEVSVLSAKKAKELCSVPQAPSPTMTSFLLISLIALVVAGDVKNEANAMDWTPNVGATEKSSTTLERNKVGKLRVNVGILLLTCRCSHHKSNGNMIHP